MKKLAYVVLAAGLAGLVGCASVEKKDDWVKLSSESTREGKFYRESSVSVDLSNPDSRKEEEIPTKLKYSVGVFTSGRNGFEFRKYTTDVEGTLVGADGKRPVARIEYGVLSKDGKIDSCYVPAGCVDESGKQDWRKVNCDSFGVKEGQ